jgi:hypothetical protein
MTRRRWVVFAVGALAIVLVAVAIAGVMAIPALHDTVFNPFATERFDRAKWLAAASTSDWEYRNPRGPMAEDLRRDHLRKGMRRAEVRALLEKSDNSQAEDAAANSDRYYLGHWGTMSIDGDYLIIHYDKSGRLASTEIYTH